MIVRTAGCNALGNPLFSYRFDPAAIIGPDADWLSALLESAVGEGRVFGSGETIQIGWMINLLKEHGDHTLAVFEPDFESFPIEWVDSVTTTLQHLRLQKDVFESVGLSQQLQFPTILQSSLVGADVDKSAQRLVLERAEEIANDSGWFIGHAESTCDYNDPGNLRRCSLYEVGMLVPKSIMFLALPTGCRVFLSETSVEISYQGTPLPIVPGSLLSLTSVDSIPRG